MTGHSLYHPSLRGQANWTRRFMDLAAHVSGWSKDPSTKVGAVVVDEDRRVLATGYNGFPRGVRDEPIRYEERSVKYVLVVHAEANALLNAVASVRGKILVCTCYPCPECTKLIIQAGISAVVCPPAPPPLQETSWRDVLPYSAQMLAEAGVEVFHP